MQVQADGASKDLATLEFVEAGSGAARCRLAYRKSAGKSPTIVWLGGFKSDMRSTKAEALAAWARKTGRACLRFDYSGHGESSGRFKDGLISTWRDDALAVIARAAPGPLLLVGSSMGGWISLLVAKRLREMGAADRLAGMALIAPAVDFTERLMWDVFPESIRRQIMETGVWQRPSQYSDDPYPITRALIEDGRKNLVFGEPFELGCPAHILQGRLDPDVPWRHAARLAEHLPLDPVQLTLIEDGDHRLSRDKDIALLLRIVADLAGA